MCKLVTPVGIVGADVGIKDGCEDGWIVGRFEGSDVGVTGKLVTGKLGTGTVDGVFGGVFGGVSSGGVSSGGFSSEVASEDFFFFFHCTHVFFKLVQFGIAKQQ